MNQVREPAYGLVLAGNRPLHLLEAMIASDLCGRVVPLGHNELIGELELTSFIVQQKYPLCFSARLAANVRPSLTF